MHITKVKNFLFKYLSLILLLAGLLTVVIGVWGLLGIYPALLVAGVFMIILALIIDQEEKGG